MQEKFSKTSVTIRPDYRRQLKTGEFHLRLFLYQNPKLKKSYPTNIKVTPIELTKINSEIIIPTVRHKKDLVIEILAKAKRIVKILKDDFSFEDFEEHMFGIAHRDKYDHTDVYATFQVKIDQLVAENRIGSAHVYEHVMSSFQSFRKYLKFHQVTVDFLNKYDGRRLQLRERELYTRDHVDGVLVLHQPAHPLLVQEKEVKRMGQRGESVPCHHRIGYTRLR